MTDLIYCVFFNRPIGPDPERTTVMVHVGVDHVPRESVVLDLMSTTGRAPLSPEEAKALGRSLIKAAKWMEKNR